MTPNRLLDHFNRISEAPDAIPRLRRFILDLAVRGKLVEQDPNDEPASELLKGIFAKLQTTGSDSAITDGYEHPFDLSVSWSWIKVGHAAHVEMGQSPPSEHYNQSRQGIPFYQGKTDFGRRHPTPRYWCSQPSKLAFKDDILISVRAPVGPTNVANEECCIGRGLAALRPHDGVDLEFFLLCLKSFESALASLGFGTTFVAINKKQLKSFPIPLPPLAEQHRIVAKVDELMALCDRLEAAQAERESRRDRLAAASLHRLNNGADAESFREHARFHFGHLPRLTTRPKHLQQLRQTILNLAVRGQLVPQDPNNEPASELLIRIQAEKARLIKEKKLKPQKSLLPIQEGDAPFGVPVGWSWVKADDISLNITDGFHNTPSPTAAGRPYITAKHIRPLKIDFDTCLYVDEKNHRELFAKTRVKRGDILIVNIGAGCGTPALVDVDFKFSFKNVAIMNLPTGLDQNYVLQFLMYYRVLVFEELIKGGAQPFLGLGMLREMLIPLPPLTEQHHIVAKVDQLMALCDRLEAQLTTAQTESRLLLEAVLHEALNGNRELEQGSFS